jgi:hypothetical protein
LFSRQRVDARTLIPLLGLYIAFVAIVAFIH